jgi:hypothetical protein
VLLLSSLYFRENIFLILGFSPVIKISHLKTPLRGVSRDKWWNSLAKVTFSLSIYHKVKTTISGNIWSTHCEFLSPEEVKVFETQRTLILEQRQKSAVQSYLEEVWNIPIDDLMMQEVSL